jgi:tetratricopeptide (TPR) repeat protein
MDHYQFTHLTTQEVVYDSLSYELRRNLHCGIGDYIEGAYKATLSEHIDLLAYHYFEGQTWPKAINYNLLAGQHAQREYANDAAITSCLRVLDAAKKSGPELETRTEELTAHETLGEVFWLVGRYDESLESYTYARVLVDQEGDSYDQLRHRADLCRKTAEVYERWSEYDTAFEWLEKGLDYLRSDLPTVEEARIYLMGTGLFRRQGKNNEAIDWCHRSIDAASKVDSQEARRSVAQANYNLSGIYWRRGDFDRAIELSGKSIEIFREIHDIVGEARAYNNLAIAYSDGGDWEEAIQAYDKSLSINLKIGNIQSQGFIENNLAEIHRDRGDWDKALELYKQSNDIWKRLGAPLQDAVTLSNLAQVYLYQRNFEEAYACLSEAQDVFTQVGSEDFLPELDRRLGEYYLGVDQLDEALSHAQRSVELASEQEARFEKGLSLRTLGTVYFARKDFEATEIHLLKSLQILDDLDSEYEAAKTRVVLAKLSGFWEIALNPKEELTTALEVFKKLGAKKDLEVAQALQEGLDK